MEKKNIIQKLDIKEDKEKIEFTKILDEYSNTNFGKNNEYKSIHIYTKLTNEPVIEYKKFTKQILFKSREYEWYIGGKVDGLLRDKSIIEVKNRIHKLFRVLKDYEKIQIYSYMFIFNSKKAFLVETFFKNIQPETNIIAVSFDINYWEYIIKKIENFVLLFNKFMENRELKIKLLENGPDKFKI